MKKDSESPSTTTSSCAPKKICDEIVDELVNSPFKKVASKEISEKTNPTKDKNADEKKADDKKLMPPPADRLPKMKLVPMNTAAPKPIIRELPKHEPKERLTIEIGQPLTFPSTRPTPTPAANAPAAAAASTAKVTAPSVGSAALSQNKSAPNNNVNQNNVLSSYLRKSEPCKPKVPIMF